METWFATDITTRRIKLASRLSNDLPVLTRHYLQESEYTKLKNSITLPNIVKWN